ncbi:SAM-dependent methyltransferase [Vibrio sp. OCN044]|uniref:SAM-dependent methyltransferase n=1 Tax=Vibrio tetraodonis subsp. pristinus TaxID=2695891 RepID=A0A6L8LSM4_9VIBR|nr:site-specific DNA-methyltransferase [Vibrio tetraodonis]MYM57620.1 SAM-dependent methyltransferase [Vibrio tetraodonis subsp. pristinus]
MLENKIKNFEKSLPYKEAPYSKKTWGHPLHSLCSYQGKLKPSIAHWLIKEFVPEGGSVLDPIGGVGTIPFEAAMLGRKAISNDKSPFAATIAKAKLDGVSQGDFNNIIERYRDTISKISLEKQDYLDAEFGLNAKVKDYFHPDTLETILKLRKIFLTSPVGDKSSEECFFWACLLHILHGNRPYALSRNSHPITPFAPTGDFIYKDVFEKIEEKASRALSIDLPSEFTKGEGFWGDFRDVVNKTEAKFDAIITSPPFYGMRFDRPNWMRLWFCGWKEDNFHNESLEFLERQQVKDISVYKDFFSMSAKVLKSDGLLIVHLGKGGRRDMSEELKLLASPEFRFVGEALDCVKKVAKHGIKDKGMTTAHNLLFFTKSKN